MRLGRFRGGTGLFAHGSERCARAVPGDRPGVPAEQGRLQVRSHRPKTSTILPNRFASRRMLPYNMPEIQRAKRNVATRPAAEMARNAAAIRNTIQRLDRRASAGSCIARIKSWAFLEFAR